MLNFCGVPVLVSAGMDATIRFWDLVSQKNTLCLQYKDSQVNTMCITPDGTQLAIGTWQSVRVYSLKDPTAHGLHTFNVHDQKNVTAVGFENDGRWMFTAGEDGTAKIWDMRVTQLNCQRIFQVKTPVHSVALHPNQTELIVADSAGALYVWDLRTDIDDSLITDVDMSEYIVHVDIDKAGRQCAAVTNRGNLFMWNINHNGMASAVRVENTNAVPSGFYEADPAEDFLSEITANYNEKNDLPSHPSIRSSRLPEEEEGDDDNDEKGDEDDDVAIVASNGQDLIGEAEDGSSSNVGSMPPLAPPPELLTETPTDADISHQRYANDDRVARRNNASQQLLMTAQPQMKSRQQQQQPFMYQQYQSNSFPGTQSTSSSSLLRSPVKIKAHSTFALKCRFRPDGLALVTTSSDQSAKSWSTTNHKLLNTYSMPGCKWVWDCGFTIDSKYMVTGSSDGSLRMWDMDTCEVARTYQSHSLGITAMAFRDVP